MIPKVDASIEALKGGVKKGHINRWEGVGTLLVTT